ncbi:hypothetical protein [Commensalibacter nepenthis]|uniref:Uncharacterized protein n=1 Tax=Commensalibacter nepenthis TaxID=3043872 RepID=A0ABT6Q5D5_9PROT|nr:hypothetical protein [Commensalibacter sp. TBRC 10068]MDI2112105.1 hypothetical protein [Commensalibacter sp. TBRC 10068]
MVLSIPVYNNAFQIENPKTLPIEVFFYMNETALVEARGYQDYHDTVGFDVFIVKLDLDATIGLVTYIYNKLDQTDAYNQAS